MLLTYLRMGLVSTESLRAVEVAVHTRVGLVQNVFGVRAGRVGSGPRSRAGVQGTIAAGRCAVVPVTVDARVDCVGDPGVVLAVRACRVIVAGYIRLVGANAPS